MTYVQAPAALLPNQLRTTVPEKAVIQGVATDQHFAHPQQSAPDEEPLSSNILTHPIPTANLKTRSALAESHSGSVDSTRHAHLPRVLSSQQTRR